MLRFNDLFLLFSRTITDKQSRCALSHKRDTISDRNTPDLTSHSIHSISLLQQDGVRVCVCVCACVRVCVCMCVCNRMLYTQTRDLTRHSIHSISLLQQDVAQYKVRLYFYDILPQTHTDATRKHRRASAAGGGASTHTNYTSITHTLTKPL
jgi:hypothetical protein